jgi:hypothetical protein
VKPLAIAAAIAALLVLPGCSRVAPDATPEGAVRVFVEKMESSVDDGRAVKEAFALLGPAARANLEERAQRASRGQGRRHEAWEMLAEGRFGLKFRPSKMTSRVEGDLATVDVLGESPEDRATVRCARENGVWKVEPELPEPTTPTKRGDAGM